MGRPWDEEASEQPIIFVTVVLLAQPEQAHPEHAKADEAETHP